ncbi:type II toxin-antitoxin system HicB family antitoxin [Candidatus Woesearchaeota archaeon]|nr:type II toxin-antitoxin system HicB family antitoxin [Candidatus Woesearchaeota archaeon]
MRRFRALLTPGEDGYIVAQIVGLPGCISQGKTRKEALANIKEALEGYLEVLQDLHEPIPEPDLYEVEIEV